jgi:CelD/BcsL family acetyltransferase involved in cellulose biosynthesis
MAAYCHQRDFGLNWPSPFVLPAWLAAWWPHFAGGHEWYLFSVHVQKQLVGLAPLMRKGAVARLIGDIEVCDHLDFVIAPQRADDFYPRVLDTLARDGIQQLILEPIRDGSSVISHLLPTAQKWGARVRCERQAQLLAMPLPTSWEAYLQRLKGKERHEIRRKLRRLNEAGRTSLRCVFETAAVPAAIQTFFDLFRSNQADKAAFMNGPMVSFFQRLATNLADAGLLKLYFLYLDDRPIAAALCIDYKDTVYLYNSGYDADFRALSAGLMSKVLSIQASIRDGRQVYDFLKGSEIYKKRLGGKPVDIYRCVLDLDARPADESSADEKNRMVPCRPIR